MARHDSRTQGFHMGCVAVFTLSSMACGLVSRSQHPDHSARANPSGYAFAAHQSGGTVPVNPGASLTLAYIDTFYILGIMCFGRIPYIFLMKRNQPGAGGVHTHRAGAAAPRRQTSSDNNLYEPGLGFQSAKLDFRLHSSFQKITPRICSLGTVLVLRVPKALSS